MPVPQRFKREDCAVASIMKLLWLIAVCSFCCLALARADEESAGQTESPKKECPTHEEYRECQSSSCAELRCGEVFDPLGPCTADCRSDCFCKQTFFRHPNGSCVAKEHCPEGGDAPVVKFPPEPKPCGTNEVWKECVGSNCAETTCKIRVIGPGCTKDCLYDCYCADGFYRNSEGNCVTLDQCPPGEEPVDGDAPVVLKFPPEPRPCGTNEVWKECVGSSCAETTCKKRVIGPDCTKDCLYDCYCAGGFYRNAEGNCVTLDQCPPEEEPVDGDAPVVLKFPPEPRPCATNEVWKECVGSSCAETTCKKRVIGPDCTKDCLYDCYCAGGFYRNAEGNCVTLDQCPPEEEPVDGDPPPVFKFPPEPQPCATNEVWKECVGSSCAETTCEKRVIGPGCTYDCRYGCYCADGFYRNAEGDCVTLDQCPPEEERPSPPHPQCGPHQEWKSCVSSSCAETTCEKRTIGPACTADCQHGCYCSDGFFRNAQNDCVREDQCPTA